MPKKDSRKKKDRRREHDDRSTGSSSSSSSSSPKRRERRKKKHKRKHKTDEYRRDKKRRRRDEKGEALGESCRSAGFHEHEEDEKIREENERQRAAQIENKFGYTQTDNPFNDPNIAQSFVWKKRDETRKESKKTSKHAGDDIDTFEEIEKVRKRRKERELKREEMERIRAEEDRLKEYEKYDEWAQREEHFHLQQQKQRTAIRLVEGREKPIDVLAKNLLLYGSSSSSSDKRKSTQVKYRERYNALEAIETLEIELQEPQFLLKNLKLTELEELLTDIDTFYTLEKEAAADSGGSDENSESFLRYWDSLRLLTQEEIQILKNGGESGSYSTTAKEMSLIFKGQSKEELEAMKQDIESNISKNIEGTLEDASFDLNYWSSVLIQLNVYIANLELSALHSKMLVRQLERLEQRRKELAEMPESERPRPEAPKSDPLGAEKLEQVPPGVADDGSDSVDEELDLSNEIKLATKSYNWSDKYRPRKPRYFNRVRTGFDWNKYNKAHYDEDNPPPKIVQGYKFNIFYPDLIDPMKTPRYSLEPADSDEFCIIRFRAGPPYEDIAFKIINREWDRARKRGFKSTFERGILSLYFNFLQYRYRR